jgi:hypothetical protein
MPGINLFRALLVRPLAPSRFPSVLQVEEDETGDGTELHRGMGLSSKEGAQWHQQQYL